MPFHHIDTTLPRFRSPVLTIGTFDGVHLGHRAIIAEVVSHARAINGESIVITFEPHPRQLLSPGVPLQLLTPLAQKAALLQNAGIDHVVVQHFDEPFSRLSAEEYVAGFLIKTFAPSAIVIGYDHRFGYDRSGDIQLLESFAEAGHFEVHQIPAQMVDAAAVSSTKIRRALESGDVATAAAMLGRPYTLAGIVVKGDQLGRTIGYPTANISPQDANQLVPANGVYAVRASMADGSSYDGMLNIGVRPTVAKDLVRKIEVNLFRYDGDLYGQMLTISFEGRLRDEEKFDSLEALKNQLAKDAAAAAEMLLSNTGLDH